MGINIPFGKEYFPLNNKIELIYESTVGKSKRIFEKEDSLFKSTIIADNFRYDQTFYQKDDGLYLVKTEQSVKILFIFSKHAVILYPEPLLYIQQPLQVGNTWNWKGYQIKNNEDTTSISATGRVIAEEEIEVPAGKFRTLKVEIIIANLDGQKTTFTQWLAKDLGSIKMNVKVEGQGLIQLAMGILGYDEVNSELTEIKYLE
jgi:hypothetical protein